MSESDEAIDVEGMVGSSYEVDLDAETEEVEEKSESADSTSEADTDEDPNVAEGEETGTAPEDEDEESETPTPTLEPFSFSADGTQFDVPGAVEQELDDGEGGTETWIGMPKSAWLESVQPHVGDRGVWQRNEAALKNEIAALDPTKNPVVIEASALLEGWKAVTELSADERSDWMENGISNMEHLKLEAENKALRESRETESNVEPDYSEVVGRIEADVPLQVEAAMARLKIELPGSARKEVTDRLWARIQRGEGIYVTGEDHGLEAGQLGVHHDVIDEAVIDAVGRRESGAVKAEKANAEKKKAPRQVAVKDSPAPSTETKQYESKDAWESAMGLNS